MASTLIDPQRSAFVLPPDHVLSSSLQHTTLKSQTFLQVLSDSTHNSQQDCTSTCAPTYVHPLVKKLSTKLSKKSLEMCTENLGSESGSDIIKEVENNSPSVILHRNVIKVAVKTTKREYNFPPPLTSIDYSISMESYRENGRLVMNVVVLTDTSNSLFYAQRINGRLVLRLKMGDLVDGNKIDEQDDGEINDEKLNGYNENVEGNIGIDENMAKFRRCNEAGGERMREGHLWNMETCRVVT